jgi:hypothetical protein
MSGVTRQPRLDRGGNVDAERRFGPYDQGAVPRRMTLRDISITISRTQARIARVGAGVGFFRGSGPAGSPGPAINFGRL